MARPETEVHWLTRLSIWIALATPAAVLALLVAVAADKAGWWSGFQLLAAIGVWLVLTPLRKAAARVIHKHMTSIAAGIVALLAYWTCGDNDLPTLDPAPLGFERCISDLYSPDAYTSPVAQGKRRLEARIGSAADAEDIVHDTLINVCEEASSRHVPNLPAYFSNALNNARIDAWRKVTRREACVIGFNPTHFPVDTRSEWDWSDVKQAINCNLSDQEQYLLLLWAEGRTSEEIADALGIEPAAARQRIKRIREKLKSRLPEGSEALGY